MSELIRGVIKQSTLERLGKYAKARVGASVDDLINSALDTLETRLSEDKELEAKHV